MKKRLLLLGLISSMMFTPLAYVHAEDYSSVETSINDVPINKLAEQLALIDQATKKIIIEIF